jgi:hypothetical protein
MIVRNWRGGLPIKLRVGLDAGPQKGCHRCKLACHRRRLDERLRLVGDAGAEGNHKLGELLT